MIKLFKLIINDDNVKIIERFIEVQRNNLRKYCFNQ